MNREQLIKVLNSPRASKEQLRAALASALGVPYEAATKEKAVTVFTQCRDAFLEAYKAHTKIEYSFAAMDGRALSQLILKIEGIVQQPTDDVVVATFRALITKLPDWFKANAFSLVIINNKFNEIVASIKKNGEKGITDDYKKRILNNLKA